MDDMYDYYERLENGSANGTSNGTSHNYDLSVTIEDLAPVFAILSVVGFLTNGALLFVLRRTNLRHAPNSFIFSLALADFIVVTIVLPLVAVGYSAPSYPFHEAVCKLTESANEIAAGVTAFTLPALAAFCFLDGREPMLPSGKSEWNVAVAAVWALAIVMALPVMIYSFLDEMMEDGKQIFTCVPNLPMFLDNWITTKFVLYVATPLAAVVFFYGVAQGKRTVDVQRSAERDYSRVALVLAAVFAACYVPGYAVDITIALHPVDYNNVWHILSLAGYCLTFVYRCLNPIALYYASGSFRRRFNRDVLCWCTTVDREPVDEELLQD